MSSATEPTPVTPRLDSVASAELGVLSWRFGQPVASLSSAAVGGGFSRPAWVLNARVSPDYERTDLDAHLAAIAAEVGLTGTGVGLLTAASLERRARGDRDGVVVDATAGLGKPTMAASHEGGWSRWEPGTINLVAQLPVGLSPAAAVNAVITITEAKAQALADLDVPGTGTASDSVTVVWPADDAEPAMFAGPRSVHGAALAVATYDAVLESGTASIAALRG